MKKEKYISLEIAQSIDEVAKEKGVELPDSEYVYYPKSGEMLLLKADTQKRKILGIKAFDCQELGEILKNCGYFLPQWINYEVKFEWRVNLDPEFWKRKTVFKENEVEARGKMLLYLLSNDLLK